MAEYARNVNFTIFVLDMPELLDTHSHIYDEAFDADFDDVVSRAKAAGVVGLVMPGIDISSYGRLISAAERLGDYACPCIGLHPTSVAENWKEELQFVFDHVDERHFFAIGEIGLDEYWSKDFVKEQIEVFERQIDLASRKGLPVIIHLREASEDMFRVLEDMKGVPIKGTMHAFSGSYETYRRLLSYEVDLKFGIGGVVTYKNAGVALSLEKMSLDDIVLETDCPWLTPVPFRGKRNESSYVSIVAQKVAQIKNISLAEVSSYTTRNARALFNIK